MALWCGDDTAKRAGRLTLNPIKHIDPVGSIIVPLVFALSGLPAFGWAKPVPVSINNLRHPRNQAVLVGLVGPCDEHRSCRHRRPRLPPHRIVQRDQRHRSTGRRCRPSHCSPRSPSTSAIVNIILAVFNLIPIPPLDGSALVERLLPAAVLPQYYRMRFGFMIIVLGLVLFDQSLLQRLFCDVENWFVTLSA